MRIAAAILVLLFASTAHAERDPAFEEGLVEVSVQGSQVMPGPQYVRPQLVHVDTSTRKTVGGVAAIAGGLSLASGWVLYVTRQSVRLRVRSELGDAVEGWESLGRWSLGLSVFGSANIVASEYMLLPESKSVPTLAWVGGVVGVGVAAVGVGFLFGEHCGPIALQPGTSIPKACLGGTADATFGPLLLATAAPLINWPLTYVLRSLFAGAPDSLTLSPTGVTLRGSF